MRDHVWTDTARDVEPIAVIDEGLGNSCYLVDLGDGSALVVDPPRDRRAVRTAAEKAADPLRRRHPPARRRPVRGSAAGPRRRRVATGRRRTPPVRASRHWRRRAGRPGRRPPGPEFTAGHLPGAVHIELGALAQAARDQPVEPTMLACGHGERAMGAASLLERAGHRDLAVLARGPDDWAQVTGETLQVGP